MIDGLSLDAIASEVGTPVYIYSLPRLLENYRRLVETFAPLNAQIHYSVKANGNRAILRALNAAGSGFDCVSSGEIFRTLRAGGSARDIVFAGVGKTRQEIAFALQQGIGWFNVENVQELEHINACVAEMELGSQQVALRFNPQLPAKTHPYMATGHEAAKFGLTADVIETLMAEQDKYPHLEFAGVHIHIGSQLGDTAATVAALEKLLSLIRPWQQIKTINLGGGLPVAYRFSESFPPMSDFVSALVPYLQGYRVLLEPGRSIVADAGLLVAEVLYVKQQAGQLFHIVDASMAELIRTPLYQAYHEVLPLQQYDGDKIIAQVVGPVCESADVLARDRQLPPLQVGDKVALMTAGAYGMTMASNYNSRLRPAEVVVDAAGDRWLISRQRETHQDLLSKEL